ncbi:MAG TPA: PrsW family intramembrane metalloprotease [Kofleriaceae bacterium]|jgi:RsiW-degrading membrane proteinase PrsW (M82 family)
MNMHLQVALSGAIPALIALWLVDRLDAKRPEPRSTRWLVVLVGMLSVIPALVLELVLSAVTAGRIEPQMTYQGSSFQAFVVAAGVEEACKIAMVYWVVWRRPEFDERLDGIVYASRGGLGFALVENVLYLLNQHSLQGQIVVWVERALLAVPGHAMWSGMIGAMAARRRFDGTGLGLIGGYLLAVAFHGAYDVSVFVQQPLHLEGRDTIAHLLLLAPVGLTVAAFLVVRSMARTALRLDDAEAVRVAARSALPPYPG